MPGPKTSDYFAELYVAGRFAESGWNVYFPHRDKGFDFIVSKRCGDLGEVIRPVQVKGKYPTAEKGDCAVYGYIGKLSQLHQDMVLAIPFFSHHSNDMPACSAYLPYSLVRKGLSKGYHCQPATLKNGKPQPRRDYKKFFGDAGIKLIESPNWSQSGVGVD